MLEQVHSLQRLKIPGVGREPIETQGIKRNEPQLKPSATPLSPEIIAKSMQEAKEMPTAVFLPEVVRFFENCGIQSEYVDPAKIGKGANHTVFMYNPPGEEPMVIKIPNESASLSESELEEKRNINVIQKAFGKYTLPTEVRKDQSSGKYCVVQKAVKGRAITNKNYKEGSIRDQLSEIVKMNHKLYEEQGISLDFVGMPGFTTWVKKQFKKFLLRDSEIEVSNLIVNEEDGKVYIIDYDLLEVKGSVGIKKKAVSALGFYVNRVLMKHYFDEDIKKPKK